LADGVNAFVTKVKGLIQRLPSFGIDPSLLEDLDRLKQGAQIVSLGAAKLNQAFNVNGGINNGPFSMGLAKLDTGLSALVSGQEGVVAGVEQLEAGAKQIAEGNAQVKDGWDALTAGATQLDAGAAQIA